jgi:hypothetical protein
MVGRKNHIYPDKEKTCNHCKKKGHVENKCWKKNPELTPDKVKVAWKKQAEKKAKKTYTAATAFEDEDKMVLTLLDLPKDNIKFSSFNMNDAFNMVPINKEIVFLNDFEDNDDEESDDKEACHEETDDKEEGSNDYNPLVTVLDDSTDMDLEVSNEDSYDLDLSLCAVDVIADATFTTGAHILS